MFQGQSTFYILRLEYPGGLRQLVIEGGFVDRGSGLILVALGLPVIVVDRGPFKLGLVPWTRPRI